MKSPGESSAWFRAAFLILVLAITLHVIGFSTASWSLKTYTGNEIYQVGYEGVEFSSRTGLWEQCHKIIIEICANGSLYKNQGWFVAVQVFESLGLGFLVVAIIMSAILMLCVTSKLLTKLNINICSIAGMCIVIGTGIYTIKKNTDDDPMFDTLGYSCWFTWIVSLALFIAVILLECDRRVTSARQIGVV